MSKKNVGKELAAIRDRLDGVDKRILEALAERQQIISDVARLKSQDRSHVRDVLREEDQLTRLVDLGRQRGLGTYYVTRLFREILEHSVRLQQEYLADQQNPERLQEQTIVVSYQGTAGAYSHLAASKHFSTRDLEVVYRGYESFQGMLEAVQNGDAQYGVLPIENTTAGSINEAYDLLSRMNLALVGEDILRVEHCLVAVEDVPVSHIRRVYSHPQALAQCANFLSGLKHCTVESFTDTAMAVKKIRNEQDLSQAAIASEEAAQLYGLKVIKRDIANQKDNYTRFVVVAREPVRYDTRIPCKTSLIFATRDEEGALLECLNVLATHGLNLTKLESRPRPNVPWEYLFYVDVEGNVDDPHMKQALQQMVAHTSHMKVLGSYPARNTRDARPAEPRRPFASDSSPQRPAASSEAPQASVLQMLERKPYKLVSRAQRVQDTQINVRGVVVGGSRAAVIAGPPFVESREQILECARIAKDLGADVLRGSCFREQTAPDAFAGLGYQALEWLEKAGREVGLPVATEVLDPADLHAVARRADMLELGARDVQNYELLKEAAQVDRPLILKRGLLASIDEWLAAAEYILANGNQQVILCERGIRTFETATRSTLDLSAVPIVRERTHLPIVVDPSQACANWRWIEPMADASLASGAHGVVVEMHPDPERALGDGSQALTFDNFERLMKRLQPRLG